MASIAIPDQLRNPHTKLAEAMRECYASSEQFVKIAYPWGETGTPLSAYQGPDTWQLAALRYVDEQVRLHAFDRVHPVAPIRIAVPSGHGTGKGAFAAWIVDWIMSTRPESQGTVTANTAKQLSTKTWAAIQYWTKLCITSSWFDITSELMWFKGGSGKASWKCAAMTCAPENAEAFQGQHSPRGTSFYIFDECSNIDRRIFHAAEGGLTDGEPMIFCFGQPTRSDGEFYDISFGEKRSRWKQFPIDSRDSALTNKAIIQEWLDDYGEDSDFFRVRVRGLNPKSGDLQFIASDSIFEAQKRETPITLPDEPLLMGIDYARGGVDKIVIRWRKGKNGRILHPTKIPGEKSRDSMAVATKIADLITKHKPDAVFGDATGGSIGGPINDRLRQLGYPVIDVQFGGESPDPHYANMRSYMWSQMRDWLANGGAIDNDKELAHDLSVPGSKHNKNDRVLLESKEDIKKRGEASPDNGDALACTFSVAIAPKPIGFQPPKQYYYNNNSWMGAFLLFALMPLFEIFAKVIA